VVTLDHLWCSVTRRATGCLQKLAIPEYIAESKIDNLDVAVIIQKQIFGLQVTVDDVHCMYLLDSCNDLMEKAAGLGLLHSAIGHDVIEELATGGVLHDQVKLPSRLNDLIELHDVGMPYKLEDVHLSGHALHICNLLDAVLFEDLHRDSLAGENMSAELYLAESALADGLAQNIMADGLRSRSHS
jgi:hypothetical protein